jgi:hypothetical protein
MKPLRFRRITRGEIPVEITGSLVFITLIFLPRNSGASTRKNLGRLMEKNNINP